MAKFEDMRVKSDDQLQADLADLVLVGHPLPLEEVLPAAGQRADPGVQRTVAIAVAPGGAITAALVPAGADQAVNIGLHDQLHHALGDGPQKITIAGLRSKLFDQ